MLEWYTYFQMISRKRLELKAALKNASVIYINTVRQNFITNHEAPQLRGVATKHYTIFGLRRIYLEHVDGKNRAAGFSVIHTSLKVSVEDRYLHIFIAARWFDTESIH